MANTKISTLSSASTPLSGSEIVPINQSGTTDSVTVANLTVGRDVNTARLTVGTGVDALTGNGTGQVILTGAGQTLQTPGKPTLYHKNSVGLGIHSDYAIDIEVNGGSSTIVAYQVDPTGNIIQKVAGKGINFTANTPASGMTSQNLTWYEEGTWTPTDASGASLSITKYSATYTRIGRVVTVQMDIGYPSTVSASTAVIGGLPFTSANNNGAAVYTNSGSSIVGAQLTSGGIYFQTVSGGNATNAQMSSSVVRLSCSYQV